jgi:hypothetical protein
MKENSNKNTTVASKNIQFMGRKISREMKERKRIKKI